MTLCCYALRHCQQGWQSDLRSLRHLRENISVPQRSLFLNLRCLRNLREKKVPQRSLDFICVFCEISEKKRSRKGLCF
jgi:hypothetical protein